MTCAAVLIVLSSAARDPNDTPASDFPNNTASSGPTAAPRAVTDSNTATAAGVWFEAVDVTIDAGDTPLAAYQFELTAAAGDFTIVGVEGGEHPAFSRPPHYDSAALAHDRIILAAYSTSENLPVGRTRVATVHVMVTGELTPAYAVHLTVAAAADGTEIPAEIAAQAVAVE